MYYFDKNDDLSWMIQDYDVKKPKKLRKLIIIMIGLFNLILFKFKSHIIININSFMIL